MTDQTSSPDILEEEYNKAPYVSFPFGQTHPTHLYTIAKLFKLKPKAVEKARILELGCASGGNIIPVAYHFPTAEFLGIDLSAREINEGIKLIEDLNIKNITLRHQSIADFDKKDGKFDYIICHGVYSWVNSEVREKILQICHENLSKNGLAYVSYNTYPGWHMVNSVRDLMMWHTKSIADPAQRAKQARFVLQFITDGLKEDNSPYASFLKGEIKILSRQADSYLLHDHLSTFNNPVYFYQFMEEATKHKLVYLSDTNLSMMYTENLPPQFATELRKIPNIVVNGQYMDFIRNQRFRCTLLCHEDQEIQRNLNSKDIEEFYLQFNGKSMIDNFSEKDIKEGQEIKFTNGSLTLTLKNSLSQLAMLILIENGQRSLHYRELSEELVKRSAVKDIETIKKHLNNDLNLMRVVFAGFCNISLYPSEYCLEITEKPYTTPLVRYQSQHQNYVTNFHHHAVSLDPISKLIMPLMDGKHTLNDFAKVIEKQANEKKLTFSDEHKQPILDKEMIKVQSKNFCKNRLEFLLKNALLYYPNH